MIIKQILIHTAGNCRIVRQGTSQWSERSLVRLSAASNACLCTRFVRAVSERERQIETRRGRGLTISNIYGLVLENRELANIPGSIVVSIPACHAGDRGSNSRQEEKGRIQCVRDQCSPIFPSRLTHSNGTKRTRTKQRSQPQECWLYTYRYGAQHDLNNEWL